MEVPGEAAPDQTSKFEVQLNSPRFLAFLAAQFLGVVNDNAFRVTLILFMLSIVIGETRQVRYSSFSTALFQIPFLLFSPFAGYLTDRFAKHRVLVWTKVPEIAWMALATVGFYFRSLPFLYFVLFLTAARTAFFAPSKYGILPEIFADSELSAANGVVELVNDLAVLFGSLFGVYLYSLYSSNLEHAGLLLVAIAVIGTVAVMFVPRAPAGNANADFQWNILRSFRRDYAEVRANSVLFYALIGIAWFGFIAAFFFTVVPVFGRNELGLDEPQVGLLFALLSIGVGIGAVLAGWLSRGHVEIGLVPLGSLGITIFSLLLADSGGGRLVPFFRLPLDAGVAILMIGVFGGIFFVPLQSMLQQRAPAGMKGRVVAFSNVLMYGAILLAAGVPSFLTGVLGMSGRQVILFAAFVTLGGTIYVVRMLPDFLARLVLWLLANTIYRIRVLGAENQPKGGALLVGNHVSYVDPIILSATTSRMIRNLCQREYYEKRLLNWYFRINHVIPISAHDTREVIEAALESTREVIRQGHVFGIFAEGMMSRTGNLAKFHRGLERIAGGANCPIIPFYLDGVWGSIFSNERGRYIFKWPKHWFQPVTVVYGKPMPPDTKADEVYRAIQDLSSQTFASNKNLQQPLHVTFIRRAKRRWHDILATGPDGRSIRFSEALARVIGLSQALWASGDPLGERVGILMPPGIDAMLANFATWFAGHIPVNIDAADIAHDCVSHAQLVSVITTRDFERQVDTAHKLSSAKVKYFEDADATINVSRVKQLTAICRWTRATSIAKLFVRGNLVDVDQVATILFSYRADSPEQSRGVMLTHHNLLSNLESLRQVFRVSHEDCILGLIPFSNSMAFASTLVLPALSGMRVAYGGPLLGTPQLATFCRNNRITLLPVSPAILASVLDTVDVGDLPHLAHVAVGGGEIDDDLRARFTQKFGVEPLQGYGFPECAPLISLNVPDFKDPDNFQPGTRRGTVGHPVPGVSVRVVDPASGAILEPGVEGMLLVSGPNLMKGYLEGPELTSQVIRDGWFHTGDRASIDSDGFLTIGHQKTDASSSIPNAS